MQSYASRIVLHLDMDAFFAAVEARNNPHFRGRPVVVGADPKGGLGRGVVSTANYEARKFGIRSAMPIRTAWKLCPTAVFLPVDGALYASVADDVMSIVCVMLPHAPIERVSIDELFADVSHFETFDRARACATAIQTRIRDEQDLTASIGIGPNKLLAKIASDFKKPAGLTVVTPHDSDRFLAPLSVRVIPGIGPKTEAKLRALGIMNIKELRALSRGVLTDAFGAWGDEMFYASRGVDDDPVVREPAAAKTLGEQETFETDTLNPIFLVERLDRMCNRVWHSLAGGHAVRAVVITVRFADFSTKTRMKTLRATQLNRITLRHTALNLFLPFLDKRENPSRRKIRLLGVRVALRIQSR